MLSLAKVLVLPPSLLVADEISLGLAPVVIDAVYEGLRRINQAGTALLVVEQQVDRVLDLAGTAVVLEHGSVAYSGNADGALAAVEQVMRPAASGSGRLHLRRRGLVEGRCRPLAGGRRANP
jgi:branched-chain amino acid transport system ATP-binding protein